MDDSKEFALEAVRAIKRIDEFKSLTRDQRKFILVYCKTMNVLQAAKITGIQWAQHYNWLRSSKTAYAKALELAKIIASDFAEGDIYHRAYLGKEVTRSRHVGGEVVTETTRQKSDVLAMFLLKGLKPQYRDNYAIAQVTGPVQLNIGYSSPPPAIDVTPAVTSSEDDKGK